MTDEQETSKIEEISALLADLSDKEVEEAAGLIAVLRRAKANKRDFLSEFMGIEFVDKGPGYAKSQVEVCPRLFNPYGVLSGAVLFTMMDYGMGAALASTLGEGELSATIEIKINFISAATTGNLICETTTVSRGSRVAVLESKVETEAGKLVAMATGSFYVIKR